MLQQYMRVMGLSNWNHWVAYFITNYVVLIFVVGMITLMVSVPVKGKKILDNADPSLILVFLLLYAVNTVCFAFAVSVFYAKGNTSPSLENTKIFST